MQKSLRDLQELKERCELTIKNFEKILSDELVINDNLELIKSLLEKYKKILRETKIELNQRLNKEEENA